MQRFINVSVQLTTTTSVQIIVCQIKLVKNISPHQHSVKIYNTKTLRHYYIPIWSPWKDYLI